MTSRRKLSEFGAASNGGGVEGIIRAALDGIDEGGTLVFDAIRYEGNTSPSFEYAVFAPITISKSVFIEGESSDIRIVNKSVNSAAFIVQPLRDNFFVGFENLNLISGTTGILFTGSYTLSPNSRIYNVALSGQAQHGIKSTLPEVNLHLENIWVYGGQQFGFHFENNRNHVNLSIDKVKIQNTTIAAIHFSNTELNSGSVYISETELNDNNQAIVVDNLRYYEHNVEYFQNQANYVLSGASVRLTGSAGGGGGGGVTDHGGLTGLADDDHKQYLLVNGTRGMSGSINMNGFNITDVGTIDGVDVSAVDNTLDAHILDVDNPHSTKFSNLVPQTLADLNGVISDGNVVSEDTFNESSGALKSFTASIQAFTASIVSFTASVQTLTASLITTSASHESSINTLLNASGTFNTQIQNLFGVSASHASQIDTIKAATGSIQSATASLQSATASLQTVSASLIAASASYRSELNSQTASINLLTAASSTFRNELNAQTASIVALQAFSSSHYLRHLSGAADQINAQDLGANGIAINRVLISNGLGGWTTVLSSALGTGGSGGTPDPHAASHLSGASDPIDAHLLRANGIARDRVLIADGLGGWITVLSSAIGIYDHGALTGLADNDHPQYALSSVVNAMSASLQEATASLQSATASLQTVSSSYLAVSASYNTLSASYISFSASLNAASATFAERLNVLTNASATFRTELNSQTASIARLDAASGTFRTELTILTNASSTFRTELTALTSSVVRLDSASGTFRSELTILNNASATFRTELTALTSTVTRLDSASGTFRTQLNAQTASINLLTAASSTFRTELNSQTASIARLDAASGTFRTELTILNNASATFRAELTALTSTVVRLDAASGTFRNELNSQTASINLLTAASSTFRTELTALTSTVVRLDAASGTFRTELNIITAASSTFRTELNSQTASIVVLQAFSSSHASRHLSGGVDPIDAQLLRGNGVGENRLLISNGAGGWTTVLSTSVGLPAGAPGAHAASHLSGGSDQLSAQQLAADGIAANRLLISNAAGGWTTILSNSISGKDYDAFTASVQSTTASLLAASSSFETRIGVLTNASATFRTELNSLTSSVVRLDAASGTFRTELNILNAASATFRAELNSQTASIARLDSASGTFRTELNIITAASSTFRTELTALTNSVVRLDSASGTFRSELTLHTASINLLTAASSTFRTELTALTSTVTRLDAASGTFRTELNIITAASSTFRAELNSQTASIVVLQAFSQSHGSRHLSGAVDQINAQDLGANGIAVNRLLISNANGGWTTIPSGSITGKDYDAFTASVQSTTASLLAASASFNSSITVLTNASATFRNELNSQTASIARLDAASGTFRSEISAQTASINLLTAASSTFRTELTALTSTVTGLNAASATFRSELSVLTNASATFRNELNSQTASIARLDAASGTFRSELTLHTASINLLTAASSTFRTELNSQTASIARLDAASGTFRSELTILTNASATFRTELTALTSSVVRLDNASGTFRTELTALTSTVTSLNAASGTFRTELNSQTASINLLTAASSTFRTELTALTSTVVRLNAASGTFRTELNVLTNASASYRLELNSQTASIVVLQAFSSSHASRHLSGAADQISAQSLAANGISANQLLISNAAGGWTTVASQSIGGGGKDYDAFTASMQLTTASLIAASASFNSSITILTNASATFRTELTALTSTVVRLDAASGTFRSELTALTNSVVRLDSASGTFRTQLNAQTASINLLTAASSTFRTELTALTSTVVRLDAASGTFRNELNSQTASIVVLQAFSSSHAARHLSGAADQISAQSLAANGVAVNHLLISNAAGGWTTVASSSIAGSGGAHASTHLSGGADPIDAQSLRGNGLSPDRVLVSDGLGGWKTVASSSIATTINYSGSAIPSNGFYSMRTTDYFTASTTGTMPGSSSFVAVVLYMPFSPIDQTKVHTLLDTYVADNGSGDAGGFKFSISYQQLHANAYTVGGGAGAIVDSTITTWDPRHAFGNLYPYALRVRAASATAITASVWSGVAKIGEATSSAAFSPSPNSKLFVGWSNNWFGDDTALSGGIYGIGYYEGDLNDDQMRTLLGRCLSDGEIPTDVVNWTLAYRGEDLVTVESQISASIGGAAKTLVKIGSPSGSTAFISPGTGGRLVSSPGNHAITHISGGVDPIDAQLLRGDGIAINRLLISNGAGGWTTVASQSVGGAGGGKDYDAFTASVQLTTASLQSATASLQTVSASYLAVSASYNVISASYISFSSSYLGTSSSFNTRINAFSGTTFVSGALRLPVLTQFPANPSGMDLMFLSSTNATQGIYFFNGSNWNHVYDQGARTPLSFFNSGTVRVWLHPRYGVSGTTNLNSWRDQSGFSNDAISPQPSYEPIILSSSALFDFDGSDDKLKIANNSSIDATDRMIVAFTFVPNTTVGDQFIASKSTTTWMIQRVSAELDFQVQGSWLGRGGALTASMMHRVIFDYNGNLSGNSDRLKLYINGVQQLLNFYTYTVAPTLPTSATDLFLGALTGSSITSCLNGKLGSFILVAGQTTDSTIISKLDSYLSDSDSAEWPNQHRIIHLSGGSDQLNAQDLGANGVAANRLLISNLSGGWTTLATGSMTDALNAASASYRVELNSQTASIVTLQAFSNSHSSRHLSGGADPIDAQSLGASGIAVNQLLISNAAGGWTTVASQSVGGGGGGITNVQSASTEGRSLLSGVFGGIAYIKTLKSLTASLDGLAISDTSPILLSSSDDTVYIKRRPTSTAVFLFEDFIGGVTTAAGFSWTFVAGGTGATIQTDSVSSASSRETYMGSAVGVISLDTGTTAAGGVTVWGGQSSFSIRQLTASSIEWRLVASGSSSAASQDYRVQFGWFNTVLSGVRRPTTGIFFEMTASNRATWNIVAISGASTTAYATSEPINSASFMKYKIETIQNPIGAFTSSFYVNDILIGAISTSLPISRNQPVGPAARIVKEIGTSQRDLFIDWCELFYEIDR